MLIFLKGILGTGIFGSPIVSFGGIDSSRSHLSVHNFPVGQKQYDRSDDQSEAAISD